MPLQATSGAASYDAFGGGVPVEPNYIESVFSTFLYTGNGSTQTITNGIDLAGEGGLVWGKVRVTTGNHNLYDTARGATKRLITNGTFAEGVNSTGLTSFNSNGFTLGSDGALNFSGETFVSWTFRKQPKFFDVVTYTGQTDTPQTIAHNLGSAPGMIIIKAVNDTGNWVVYHRSNGAGKYMYLNTTGAAVSSVNPWNNTSPTATDFSIGAFNPVNYTGNTYVAYLFAHDAGGFGLTGTDNVISCGSYTGNGSTTGPVIDLGYEPQWVMIKAATRPGGENWVIYDNMRGIPTGGGDPALFPSNPAAEDYGGSADNSLDLLPTGFKITGISGRVNDVYDYIYIAIRRGPMKVPTTGTSVYNAALRDGTAPGFNSGFVVDMFSFINKNNVADKIFGSRLTGTNYLVTNKTDAEGTISSFKTDYQDGWNSAVGVSTTIFSHMFQRAPGFFDVVCYTGTGANRTVAHNLAAVPELMIVKRRSATDIWVVYNKTTGNTGFLRLNDTNAVTTSSVAWNDTSPTVSDFTLGTYAAVNTSGSTYVAYLFASAPGVSKVGSYTGTGASDQVINCGFTGGARFVMIKRTDGTSNWRVWDTARGIASGNDPSLDLNNTAAEQTGFDQIDPDSSGFKVKANDFWNTSGANFIFLAIA